MVSPVTRLAAGVLAIAGAAVFGASEARRVWLNSPNCDGSRLKPALSTIRFEARTTIC